MMAVKTYEDVLNETGTLCWKTVGVSMRPLICEGRDLIVIKKKHEALKKYDVVLFKRPGVSGHCAYVLHRILRLNDDGTYWIVGDNCCGGETVREENILGVLSSMVRKGKPTSLDSLRYKMYVHLWCGCYPARFFIIKYGSYPKRAIGKLAGMIKTQKK